MMRKNLYLSFVFILGTALSVTLIVTWIIAYRSVCVDVYPEVNRSRSLYVKWVGVKDKVTGKTYGNGRLSLKTIKECFQSLETPEAVSITAPQKPFLVAVPQGKMKRCYVFPTDDVFWKINRFRVLEGSLYDKADFDAGWKKVVISKQLANTFFGTTQKVVGQSLLLNRTTYTICGIVDDVYTLTNFTYAQAWIPFTALNEAEGYGPENLMGDYRCVIMAHSKKDLDKIREETARKVVHYNESLADYRIDLYRQPDSKFVEDKRGGPGYPSNVDSKLPYFILISFILLLIPAINMSGLTLSRTQERMAEFGVRKAFGATRWELIGQIICENMVYSLLGGALGLVGSYITLHAVTGWAFGSSNYFGLDMGQSTLPPAVFFNIDVFAAALIFCTLLNLLSACIPAWRAASAPIVQSIKQEGDNTL